MHISGRNVQFFYPVQCSSALTKRERKENVEGQDHTGIETGGTEKQNLWRHSIPLRFSTTEI